MSHYRLCVLLMHFNMSTSPETDQLTLRFTVENMWTGSLYHNPPFDKVLSMYCQVNNEEKQVSLWNYFFMWLPKIYTNKLDNK